MDGLSISKRTLRSGSIKSKSTTISGFSTASQYLIINDTFRIGSIIGSGNFGEIRLGKNIKTEEVVAIKLESQRALVPQLNLEYKFYQRLGTAVGIPKIHYFGIYNKCNSLIMQFLGKNLEQLFNLTNRQFTNKTVCMIALQLIERFEYIHSKGIVYRDVKPDNFVIGHNKADQKTIFVVDFGLSKEFMDITTGTHIKYRENKNLTGTARYMSTNTHLGREQSRRDDLESLGYVFVYLLRGALPWQGLKAENFSERYKMIGTCKLEISPRQLCKNLSAEWLDYLTYVKKLEFTDKPDYNRLKQLFINSLIKSNLELDYNFDWSSIRTSNSISSITRPDPKYLKIKKTPKHSSTQNDVHSESHNSADNKKQSFRYSKLQEESNEPPINRPKNKFYDVSNEKIVYHNKKPSLMPPVALANSSLSRRVRFKRKIRKICCLM